MTLSRVNVVGNSIHTYFAAALFLAFSLQAILGASDLFHSTGQYIALTTTDVCFLSCPLRNSINAENINWLPFQTIATLVSSTAVDVF